MLFETFRRAHVAPHFGVPRLAWNDGLRGEGQDDVSLQKPSVVLVEDVVSRDDVTANSRKGGKQQFNAPLPPGAVSCGIRRRLELSTEGFWDFLFSDRWPQTCLLRVLDGEVLENILVALYRLERDHDVISYVTLALMEHQRLIKPCSKTASPKDQFIRSEELVLVELDYWAPNRRLKASGGESTSLAENHTEDAVNNSWLTVVPDSRQPAEEADDKLEDRAQYVASSASVRCNIRGLTRPQPHTDCLMPYHMIREPYLQRRQREGSVFPKLQLPEARVNLEPTVDDLQDSKKKGKEDKLSKEDMLQLGPRLEDGSEMVADDPFLQRLADEYYKQDAIVSKTRESSIKLKSVNPTTNDQKKQPKKDGKESDSLTDEEADEKKGISWVEPEREKTIEGDIRLMTKDLRLTQKNAGKKVSIRYKLHRELRRRERRRISGIFHSKSSSESDSEGGCIPAKPKPKSSDINCTKIKKWTKCPTFMELYCLMQAEQPGKESSEQDKRKGKKGKLQLSSPKTSSSKFPGGKESQRDGKGKADKIEEEIERDEKDKPNESEVQEQERQDQQTDKQSEEVKDRKAEKKERKYEDKENQQRGRRDNRKRVMAMGLRDLSSKQVDIIGARGRGHQIRYPQVPRRDRLRGRQRTDDKDGKDVEMVGASSPRHTIQPKQYGKEKFTLPGLRPSNLTADKVREMARLGITLSGTHLLTPEQEVLIREAGLIVSDDDPWHISVRFAHLVGGVCDSIGVRNTLMWRRNRMLRLIEEGRLILKMHESRLWTLVRIVPMAHSRSNLQPPIGPKLSAQDKGKSMYYREKEGDKISTTISAASPRSSQGLPILYTKSPSLRKIKSKTPLTHSKTDQTESPRSPSTVMRTATNEISKLRDDTPLAKEHQPQKMKTEGSLRCEEKNRLSETLGKMKIDPQGGSSLELEDITHRSDKRERRTIKSDHLGKNVPKRQNANYVYETYRVMKGAAKEMSARQVKDQAVGTSEYFDDLASRSKFDGDASLCPTRSEGRKGAKSDNGKPHVRTAKAEVPEISLSGLDDIKDERLFELMKLNEVFEPTKLKSSYSFEKLFADRHDQIPNYSKLLSEFQKPFKGKVSKDIKKEKNDKAKKDEKIAEPEKQEAMSTVIESDEIQKEPTAEEEQSEPMVIGKLRKFKFLKSRDYISGTLDIGQPPRNHPTLEEICTMLERALHLFIVRKERASTAGRFQSKVSVTFSRRQPSNSSGRFLAAQTRDVVSNICNTLNL